jgi:hypothetical protein
MVNDGKIKRMIVSRIPPNIEFIGVENYKFEIVYNFKYLGMNIKNQKSIKYKEVI